MPPVNEFTFFIEGKPKGKGRHKTNTKTGHTYTPAETEFAEAEVLRYWENAGKVKLSGPIGLQVNILHKRPGNHYNRTGFSKEGLRHPIPTSKPDVDNVLKLVMDALNEHAWDDDKQVCEVVMRRRWGKSGIQGMRITAREIEVDG